MEDELIKKVEDGMKENKMYLSNEENIDIRYGKLKTDHESQTEELKKANALIEELKKGNAGNETLQSKIVEYENQVKDLQAQLAQTKLDSAINIGLLSEKATDVDYLTFKLKSQGDLKLNENGEIEGWKDKVSELKKQFPNQFEFSSKPVIKVNKLNGKDEDGKGGENTDYSKLSYKDRLKLKNENPELYEKVYHTGGETETT